MANFVVQHCGPELGVVDLVPWTLFFDGSSCVVGSGIGIVLVSLGGQHLSCLVDRSYCYQQSG